MEHLQFPIGKFILPASVNELDHASCITTIVDFPQEIKKLTAELSDDKLAQTYRPEGWSIRQLVHHCADSHMNAFIRFKLSLTEEYPTIKPYREDLWAEHEDSVSLSIAPSLAIIEGVHARWSKLLSVMNEIDFQRTYVHPEHGIVFTLEQALTNYDWHCRHHLEHIRIALKS